MKLRKAWALVYLGSEGNSHLDFYVTDDDVALYREDPFYTNRKFVRVFIATTVNIAHPIERHKSSFFPPF